MEVNPPLFLAVNGVYGADELGLPLRDLIGEGVVGAGDLKVSQRGAGANMSVDVAAGVGYVVGDDNPATQPSYRVRNDGALNLAIATAHATLPRIDRVIAEVLDATFAGVQNLWRLRVITGTPTSGATLDNLNGAAAVPNNALLLANVLVAALDTSITDSEIRDVRRRALLGSGGARSGLVLIEDKLLLSSAATFDFQNIPQDLASLSVEFSVRTDAGVAPDLRLRLNNDAGTNYNWNRALITNAGVSAADVFAETHAFISEVARAASVANRFTVGKIAIPNYRETTAHKAWTSEAFSPQTDAANGQPHARCAGVWKSSAAINRVTLLPTAGQLIAGSRATLYGLSV